MDAAFLMDPGVVPEQAICRQRHVRRKRSGFFKPERVFTRGPKSDCWYRLGHIMLHLVMASIDVSFVNKLPDVLATQRVEHFIGIENQDPITFAFLDQSVTSFREILLPPYFDHLRPDSASNIPAIVQRSRVANDHAIDEWGSALQAARKVSASILDDH
jgi:hypothetical protein